MNHQPPNCSSPDTAKPCATPSRSSAGRPPVVASPPPATSRPNSAARLAGEHHTGQPIQALYTSPLLCTQQTAATIAAALDLPATTVDDLREPDYGTVPRHQTRPDAAARVRRRPGQPHHLATTTRLLVPPPRRSTLGTTSPQRRQPPLARVPAVIGALSGVGHIDGGLVTKRGQFSTFTR